MRDTLTEDSVRCQEISLGTALNDRVQEIDPGEELSGAFGACGAREGKRDDEAEGLPGGAGAPKDGTGKRYALRAVSLMSDLKVRSPKGHTGVGG